MKFGTKVTNLLALNEFNATKMADDEVRVMLGNTKLALTMTNYDRKVSAFDCSPVNYLDSQSSPIYARGDATKLTEGLIVTINKIASVLDYRFVRLPSDESKCLSFALVNRTAKTLTTLYVLKVLKDDTFERLFPSSLNVRKSPALKMREHNTDAYGLAPKTPTVEGMVSEAEYQAMSFIDRRDYNLWYQDQLNAMKFEREQVYPELKVKEGYLAQTFECEHLSEKAKQFNEGNHENKLDAIFNHDSVVRKMLIVGMYSIDHVTRLTVTKGDGKYYLIYIVARDQYQYGGYERLDAVSKLSGLPNEDGSDLTALVSKFTFATI